jgi:hypothetical protein
MICTQKNRSKIAVAGVVSAMLISQMAGAAPAVQQVSGTFNHKASVTITGSGFGSKSQAAPVVWDDASGGNIRDKWSGSWPENNPTYNTSYRSPIRNVGLPHGHISKYIAGAHADSTIEGANVIIFKTRNITSYPAYTYVSWYQRSDDAWSFGGDDNYKTFAFSIGDGPYKMPNNWYLEYNPRPTSKSSTVQWHINDDGASLMTPDANSRGWWWSPGVNPMSGSWAKIEQEIKYSSGNDGYIRLYENGVLKVNYVGPTDKYPGTQRTEGIGGYARRYGQANNWRYFADVYLDYSLARVVLANNADLSRATIVETQVPTAWSASSITASVNLGKFTNGQSAYLFVFDSSGARNTTGIPVTAGGGSTAKTPSPPSAVMAQ